MVTDRACLQTIRYHRGSGACVLVAADAIAMLHRLALSKPSDFLKCAVDAPCRKRLLAKKDACPKKMRRAIFP